MDRISPGMLVKVSSLTEQYPQSLEIKGQSLLNNHDEKSREIGESLLRIAEGLRQIENGNIFTVINVAHRNCTDYATFKWEDRTLCLPSRFLEIAR